MLTGCMRLDLQQAHDGFAIGPTDQRRRIELNSVGIPPRGHRRNQRQEQAVLARVLQKAAQRVLALGGGCIWKNKD
jgi:hypothetical protein